MFQVKLIERVKPCFPATPLKVHLCAQGSLPLTLFPFQWALPLPHLVFSKPRLTLIIYPCPWSISIVCFRELVPGGEGEGKRGCVCWANTPNSFTKASEPYPFPGSFQTANLGTSLRYSRLTPTHLSPLRLSPESLGLGARRDEEQVCWTLNERFPLWDCLYPAHHRSSCEQLYLWTLLVFSPWSAGFGDNPWLAGSFDPWGVQRKPCDVWAPQGFRDWGEADQGGLLR